jgi:hypothetical protein
MPMINLQIQREFGRVALPWVRSNGPTNPLHISCICSIWKTLHFYSSFSLNPSKSTFFHTLTRSLLPKNHMLFIVSKQCACSRRVHIEGQMSYPKLLSFSVLTFIKWRLTSRVMLQKIRFFDKKDMDVKIRVCLSRKYGRFMLFIDNNLLLPGARLHILNNIYRKLS